MSTLGLREFLDKLAISQAETDRQMKETDRQMKETDRQMKETDRQMKETDRQLKENALQMKETDRKIKELGNLFTTQWGKLVEALLESGLPKLFRERGLAVTQMGQNVEILDKVTGEQRAGIDVFLKNGTEDVAVEVKTTCRPKDVDEHVERLKLLHDLIPAYSIGSLKLYGAVAALRFESEADTYAARKGLFVLKCTDSVTTIVNGADFVPKAW